MKKLFSFLFLMQSLLLYAQIEIEKQAELSPEDEKYIDHQFYVFGEDGFMIRSRWDKAENEINFRYQLYNASLDLLKTHNEETILNSFDITTTYVNETHIVDFIYEQIATKMKLIVVDRKTLEVKTFEFNLPAKLKIGEGKIGPIKLYNYCSIKNKPHLMIIDWHQGTIKLIPILINGYKPTSIGFSGLSLLEHPEKLFLKMYGSEGKREGHYLFIIGEDEKIDNPVNFSSADDNRLMNLKCVSKQDDKYILIGTYYDKSSNNQSGLYFSEISGSKVSFIKYHNYFELNSFLEFSAKLRRLKTESENGIQEKNGKKKSYYNLPEAVYHDLIKANDAYYYLAESYVSSVRIEMPHYGYVIDVFDGYQYTHANLIKFSANGELLWDRSVELFPSFKPFTLKKFIAVDNDLTAGITIKLHSSHQTRSITFSHDGDTLSDQKSDLFTPGIGGDEKDIIKYDIAYEDIWYDNYILSCGFQHLADKSDQKEKRYIFLIQKEAYHVP